MPTDIKSLDLKFPKLALFGLVLFSFFAFLGTAPANIGLLILLIAFVINFQKFRQLLKGEIIVLLYVALSLYALISAFYWANTIPELSNTHWRHAGGYAGLIFPLVGIWLYVYQRHLALIFTLVMVGLMIDIFQATYGEWYLIERAIVRPWTYSFGKAQIGLGLYASTIVLGLVLFLPRMLKRPLKKISKVILLLVWIFFIVFFTEIIVLVKSRGVLLAITVVFPVILYIFFRNLYRTNASSKTKLPPYAVPLFLGASILILALANSSIIMERVLYNWQENKQIFSSDMSEIPYTSVGKRVHISLYGVKRWLEKPVLGWGPGSVKYLIKQHDNPQLRNLPHSHNAYIDILMRLGIIGFLLFGATVVILLNKTFHAYKEGIVRTDMLLFIFGSVGILAIWSVSATRMIHVDWRFYWLLLAGTAYSYIIKHKLLLEQTSPKTDDAQY